MAEDGLARVFVGRLASRTEGRDLEECFGDFGKVSKVEMKNGYAFVFFTDDSSAQDAIAGMNGKELHGNEIVVETARGHQHASRSATQTSSTKGIKELRISCTGLDDRTSWQDLKDWARAAGNVTFANVFNKDSQKIGVIEFEVTGWIFLFHKQTCHHLMCSD